jgi:hypothetical protein
VENPWKHLGGTTRRLANGGFRFPIPPATTTVIHRPPYVYDHLLLVIDYHFKPQYIVFVGFMHAHMFGL